MPPISLSQYSVVQGELIAVRLTIHTEAEYGQVQIEIVTAGVANPVNKLGFGTTPKRAKAGEIEADIDTQHLGVGIYEIGLVRLHSPTVQSAVPQLDFVPRRDFSRQVFDVRASTDAPRTQPELLAHVVNLEEEIEQKFAQPISLPADASSPIQECTVLVFLRDILVGVGMRFDHFELVPTNSGLEGDDAYRFVNTFLRSKTATDIQFEADDAARENARRNNPVCVLHFPSIRGSSMEQARDYCVEQANVLLLALSLSRDAGGVVFDVVVLSKTSGSAVKYAIASPYIGNLLTGQLAGESFESVRHYANGLAASETNRFLVGLYKDARRERSADFQYVRYWQILETMAEGRNYDSKDALRDFSGAPMTDNGRVRFIKGSVNIVFNLLRENQIGDTASTWKNVNTWFAFRNAVAHHGAVSRYTDLSRDPVREWARLGYEELQRSPGHDVFLWSLKEEVKLLLMRRLVETSLGGPPATRTAA